MTSIDLNADLGEGDDCDAELMQVISSCNVACGGHAGDADSIAKTVALALTCNVAVGAHPSYADRDGFGRRAEFQSGDELYEALSAQVGVFADIAASLGVRVMHLKPHGALYNDAAHDAGRAEIVARVTQELRGSCCLVGPPGSALEHAASRSGLPYVREGFVDRAYDKNGALVSRTMAGAVYNKIEPMIAQALSLVLEHAVTAVDGSRIASMVDTLCIHGDTPGAGVAARAVRAALEKKDVDIRSPGFAA